MTTAIPHTEPALTPGALQVRKTRELPDGALIEFEFAPRGWLTKKGEVRQQDWRAYFYTPAEGGKRERKVSVTTFLDAICPKGGLPRWAEARGIEGTVTAMRMGEITVKTEPSDAVEIVRVLKLGADQARDTAAERGLDIHGLLETYMRTGDAPPRPEVPEHWGYHQGLCAWLLKTNPEPVDIEELVCDPDAGYAGRRDLVAITGGLRVGYDAKTQERAGIYSAGHLQLQMYERGAVACGDEPCDQLNVVVFAANGEWREMPCEATTETVDAALAFAAAIRPIDALCESRNRAERKARA